MWRDPTSVLKIGGRANGVVYVGSEDDKLCAFNTGTGATKWTATTGSFVEFSPAAANGVVYVGSDDHSLCAFALDGGHRAIYRRSASPPAYAALRPDYRLKPTQ